MNADPRAVIVHGGAGAFRDRSLTVYCAACRAAAMHAWAILAQGGSALDAVEAAVVVLENDPLFNAGIGSVLNSEGNVELDASVMDGASRRAGAVAAVPRIQNPVTLARRVLDDGRHVLLVGDGALQFARRAGIPECPDRMLVVPRQRQRWEEHQAADTGTVGAVAVDHDGGLAAATSTGGLLGKLPGRVGDSAIIGAGTYADDVAAVSCTGVGEAMMRTVLAKTTVDLRRSGLGVQASANAAMTLLRERTGADGGLIIVDEAGNIAWARNTAHMPVAWVRAAAPRPGSAE
jgi:beta-aspartyl-peptidase (threonine type)